MRTDYQSIAKDQDRLERTATNSIRTLTELYAQRSHFIFELLQNAEDALRRRGTGWVGQRAVTFQLSDESLRVGHFGIPFNDADVSAICSVGETTKQITDIGRFGIGFKSVYAITDRPEVYSGNEAFAIEKFVVPVEINNIAQDFDETLFILPFKQGDTKAHEEVSNGLQRLGATSLLFLRHIEEVRWSIDGGASGVYLRGSRDVTDGVRRVTVVGQQHDAGHTDSSTDDEEWLVFSRAVGSPKDRNVGHVEIAFSLGNEQANYERIQRVVRSPLVVSFPTVVETYLGSLLQGPYRTTPSRDNVPQSDPWNQHLVKETGSLLIDALRWLRENDLLDTAALECLPIDSSKFGEESLVAPLFQATKEALLNEPLLPRSDGGHVPAARARLGSTQQLRDLFGAAQLAALLEQDGELAWLSGDITPRLTADLRRYLMRELDVAEITPETVIQRLDRRFLEAQPDDWILKVYEFLHGQPGLRRRLDDLPLVRLKDGTHVTAHVNGQPQAFLPSAVETGFPTVRQAVCSTGEAREFLQALGLTEPDPVDDIVRNVLPKYREEDEVNVDDDDYEADIRRILAAFKIDSESQRRKLLDALRETSFVMAVDMGDGAECTSTPGDVYLAAGRLKELFAGVEGVLLVDDTYTCLRGEEVRSLLEACGATRYLEPIPVDCDLAERDLSRERRNAGLDRESWRHISDVTIRGFDDLLENIRELSPDKQLEKASLLWQALGDLHDRRGNGVFYGEYEWGYSHEAKVAQIDAHFVRKLNDMPWIPSAEGNLQRPEVVLFETLGWKPHLFLQSMIRFKPAHIDQLAKDAGFEPGALDLLKSHGLTSVAEVLARLGLSEGTEQDLEGSPPETEDKGTEPSEEAHTTDNSEGDRSRHQGGGAQAENRDEGSAGARTREGDGNGQHRNRAQREDRSGHKEGNRTADGKSATFYSYVGVRSEDDEPDPDGLDQQTRMELEAKAIDLILGFEAEWQRTPPNNPGFDLYRTDQGGNPTLWCEVKAMTGSLDDHPVGLSSTQFEFARDHGESYWLYIVEHAGTDSARIVRIQDPAGKARTFTFDRGWIEVAIMDATE